RPVARPGHGNLRARRPLLGLQGYARCRARHRDGRGGVAVGEREGEGARRAWVPQARVDPVVPREVTELALVLQEDGLAAWRDRDAQRPGAHRAVDIEHRDGERRPAGYG